jgi:hypothetical protein
MQEIIIKVGTQDKDLDSTIDKMVKMGLIDEKNAKQFKNNQKVHNDEVKKGLGLLENARKREKMLMEAREKANNPAKIKRINGLLVKQRGHINKLTGATDRQAKSMGGLSKMVKGVGIAIAAAFTLQAVIGFGKQVIDITGEFQRLEAVLINSLGSESEAQRSLAMIAKFAAETPFAVAELTKSYVKLVNQGFKPTEAELTKLGDLASSTGKGFDQLAEAILDAQTGEFERLKEFGIRAEKQGDKVTFAFKGVKTQVDFTSDSMKDYLVALGDVNGVSGSMAAISETIEGRISNMGDAYEQMILSIDSGSGIVTKSVNSMTGAFTDLFTEMRLINKFGVDWIDFLHAVASPEFSNAMFQDLKSLESLQQKVSELSSSELDNRAVKWQLVQSYEQLGMSREDAVSNIHRTILALKDEEKAAKLSAIALADGSGGGGQDRTIETEAQKKVREANERKAASIAKKKIDMEVKLSADMFKMTQMSADEDEKFADAIFAKDTQTRLANREFELELDIEEHRADVERRIEKYEEDVSMLDDNNANDRLLKLNHKRSLDADLEAMDKVHKKKESDAAKKLADDEILMNEARLVAAANLYAGLGDLAGAFGSLATQGSNAQKALTLAGIAFDTASAIASLMAMSEANPANAVTFGAAGVAQYVAGLARIVGTVASAKQAIAGFKDGVIDIQGAGTGRSDSIPAWLSKGESVMTDQETKDHKPLLQAIRNNNLDNYLNVSYRLKPDARALSSMDKQDGFISALTQNLGAEGFNEDGIIQTMKKMDKNESARMNELARVILQGYSKRPNLRK